MGFLFEEWGLYQADIKLKGNERRILHFFKRWTPKRGISCDFPKSFTVCVDERTDLPYLKRRED